MNRFQITAEIATTVWLGTAENYKYKPNRVHFRDIYKIDDAEIYATSYEEFEKRLTPFAWEIKKEFLKYLFECADGKKFNVQSADTSLPLLWKTSYTQDVEVTSDGIATIYMNSNVWFDGVNLSLPMDKIAAEIKQRIDNRHSGDLAGIGNALTEVVVGVHID